MALIAVGFNHKNTPLEVLGKVIIPTHKIDATLNALLHLSAVNAAVILTTCNRCEIYADIQTKEHISSLIEWFVHFSGISSETFKKHAVVFVDEDTVQHLMRVASGIESMIVGESQILGQVKGAYQTAQIAGTVNKHLTRLFENALSVAKQVRSTTEIANHPISFASVAVKMSKKIFESLENKYALLVGTGEIIRLTAKHFKDNHLKHITISGRSPERMRELGIKFQGATLPLSQINKHLSSFDIIVSATASESLIIRRTAIEQALKERKHRPMYLIDLALPHDIESNIGDLEDAYLYTLETLAHIADRNRDLRFDAVAQAEVIIRSKTDKYFEWIDSNRAIDMINRLRNEADLTKKESLEQALKQLRNGKDAEEVLRFLATTLTNRLTHKPTQLLKDAAAKDYSILQIIERFLEQ